MAKTPNLNLELTTDAETLFEVWRNHVNGQGDGIVSAFSNTQIIDSAYGELQNMISEYAALENFPETGVIKRLYIALNTGYGYRWDAVRAEYVLLAGGGTGPGEIQQATELILGGIKAAEKTASETAEIKIDTATGKLYGPTVAGNGEITQATATDLGGIIAAEKTASETAEVKIDAATGKLYSQVSAELQQATESILGGIKAAEKTELETSEIKIDTATGKLYGQAGGGGGEVDPKNITVNNNDIPIFDSGVYSTINGGLKMFTAKNTSSLTKKLDAIYNPDGVPLYAFCKNLSLVYGNSLDMESLVTMPIYIDGVLQEKFTISCEGSGYPDVNPMYRIIYLTYYDQVTGNIIYIHFHLEKIAPEYNDGTIEIIISQTGSLVESLESIDTVYLQGDFTEESVFDILKYDNKSQLKRSVSGDEIVDLKNIAMSDGTIVYYNDERLTKDMFYRVAAGLYPDMSYQDNGYEYPITTNESIKYISLVTLNTPASRTEDYQINDVYVGYDDKGLATYIRIEFYGMDTMSYVYIFSGEDTTFGFKARGIGQYQTMNLYTFLDNYNIKKGHPIVMFSDEFWDGSNILDYKIASNIFSLNDQAYFLDLAKKVGYQDYDNSGTPHDMIVDARLEKPEGYDYFQDKYLSYSVLNKIYDSIELSTINREKFLSLSVEIEGGDTVYLVKNGVLMPNVTIKEQDDMFYGIMFVLNEGSPDNEIKVGFGEINYA